ncbi:hypothetical protein [Dictyobacter formicarum]|uniref:Alpha box domain-containing protein n=1 Tax=Dictyobacter formicarum TaxID=2778368 RepID=A0ABQ3VMC3_9CHLR|nr:hypothetical protein [Dictyobacter formicarum]GHO87250.1 hypothetical protein KSZ_52560 [Dictyobacter formicarum]
MWPFDQNQHQVYQQYAQAYDTGNFDAFDPIQAINHLRQFIQGAPSEMQQNIYQQHFEQMPYEQRAILAQRIPPQYGANPDNTWSMAQGLVHMGHEQPHLLQRVFSHPFLLGSAVALTGLVAKHMLAYHQQYQDNGNQQPYYNSFQQNNGFQQQQPYGFQQQPYGNAQYQQPYGNPQEYQDQQYMQQELQQERQREQELRRELQQEEREIERLEGNAYQNPQHHHHHHREEY